MACSPVCAKRGTLLLDKVGIASAASFGSAQQVLKRLSCPGNRWSHCAGCFPPCQFVANSGGRSRLPYRSSSGDARFLLSLQYALLRPEFWGVPPRTVCDTVQNILVTVGGADPHNLMPRLLDLLDELPSDFTVTIIVGPFFENRAEVERATKGCRRLVRLVYAPSSMRDLMLEADLAISASGQTLYELAATGTPTVALQVAENQAGSLQALAAEGVVRVAGCVGEDRLLANIRATVRELLGSRDTRAEMSTAGWRLVDGWGAVRLADSIIDSQATNQHPRLPIAPEGQERR